jgi:hypothetical protein
MADRCLPCEQHAVLHRHNQWGIGPANDPCLQCEAHARMHAAEEGCGGMFLILTATLTLAAVTRIRRH